MCSSHHSKLIILVIGSFKSINLSLYSSALAVVRTGHREGEGDERHADFKKANSVDQRATGEAEDTSSPGGRLQRCI